MKRKGLIILGTICISLLLVSMASAYAASSVDGLWGKIDTNSATGATWATGNADYPDHTTSTEANRYTTQNQILLDENQVRYGSTTTFANKSGFGFDGNNNVGALTVNTPFMLGEFTHYNNPINASNSFEYVNLNITVSGIQCVEGGTPAEGSTFSFSYRFDLEETNNSRPCAYEGTSVCPDRVTISGSPSASKFSCPEGDYTVQILGFAASPTKQDQGCFQSGLTYPGSTSGYFITEESADNYACLWAKITAFVPTAVDLADFDVEDVNNAVFVNWSSSSELNIQGYNLYRSITPTHPLASDYDGIQINPTMIDAQKGGFFDGAYYEFLDNHVEPGQTYYYHLQVKYSDNSIQWSDQVSVLAAHKIFAPLTIKP